MKALPTSDQPLAYLLDSNRNVNCLPYIDLMDEESTKKVNKMIRKELKKVDKKEDEYIESLVIPETKKLDELIKLIESLENTTGISSSSKNDRNVNQKTPANTTEKPQNPSTSNLQKRSGNEFNIASEDESTKCENELDKIEYYVTNKLLNLTLMKKYTPIVNNWKQDMNQKYLEFLEHKQQDLGTRISDVKGLRKFNQEKLKEKIDHKHLEMSELLNKQIIMENTCKKLKTEYDILRSESLKKIV